MRARPRPQSAKRIKETEAIGREFGHALSWSVVGSSRLNFAEAVRKLRTIEKEYVQRLSAYPEFALEVRRRIAEQLVEQALLHGCRLSLCRAKLSKASMLGWTSLERKMHVHLMYARGAFALGHNRTAKSIASAMATEIQSHLERLEKLPIRRGRKYFTDFLALAMQVVEAVTRVELGETIRFWVLSGRWVSGSSAARSLK